MVDASSDRRRVRRAQAVGAQLVVDAAVHVLVRDGLDGLSVRKVASEAGVSIGAVQHHYATKNALLVAASEYVTEQFTARADALTHRALVEGGTFAAFVAFCELLANASPPPEGTGDDTTASTVWLWYAAKATRPGPVADAFAVAWSRTEEHLADVIAELYPTLNPVDKASHLLAVLDGIAVARAAEPQRMPLARARMLVRRHLDCLSRR
ncbi:TetR/AcrR family transcriptional regulator [Corynebacterium sp. c3Ub_189]|uniref:TetR/AcrR family transcriptional regulator n=1 Tax=Corynebacterium sp. c3Ub_189 TaxID=3032331 RepID=UPI003265B015